MKFIRCILIASMLLIGYCFAMLVTVYPLINLMIFVALIARKRHQTLWSHGTARWANDEDLRRAGMLDSKTGMILGRVVMPSPTVFSAVAGLFNPRVNPAVACEQFFGSIQRFNRKKSPKELLVRLNAVHAAVFAPTGVGKGVSCVIPHLLTCPDSAVCVDFKGENAKVTAEPRRNMGQRIIILDPFSVVGGKDTFNPLDSIDKDSALAIDDCRDLATALVIRTGQEKEPHWADSAEAWIAAMTALVVRYGEPGDRSLQTVRALLTNPLKMEAAIALMCSSDAWGGMLARMGYSLTQYKDKELASTITTTNRFLRFLDTVAIAESTKISTFDPAELRNGKTTVYLVLPPAHMRSQSPLLRMWIGSMLRACVRGGLQEKNLVHFVLDESASLGHLEAIDDAVDKYRGYGIRLIFLFQSLSQLKVCFPDGQDQTLLSNTSQVFFGVNDNQTAEYVSTRLGEETIVVDSGGKGVGRSFQSSEQGRGTYGSSSNENQNWAQQARRLLKPEEVMVLSERIAITFTPGIPPLWTRLVRYYDRDFQEQPQPRSWIGVEMFVIAIILLGFSIGLAVNIGNLPVRAADVSAQRHRTF
jgi:type IV secretion system protein VirD4